MPRVPQFRNLRLPSIESIQSRRQSDLQDLAYLQAVDDKYLHLSTVQLRRLCAHFDAIRATIPTSNKRRPPEGELRNRIPSYTVGYRLKQGPQELGDAITLAQQQGAELEKHLDDLRSEPYPYASKLEEDDEAIAGLGGRWTHDEISGEEDDWDGTITKEALLYGSLDDFKRRVATMDQTQKEDALTTLKLQSTRSEKEMHLRKKKMLDLVKQIERELQRTGNPFLKDRKAGWRTRAELSELDAEEDDDDADGWGLDVDAEGFVGDTTGMDSKGEVAKRDEIVPLARRGWDRARESGVEKKEEGENGGPEMMVQKQRQQEKKKQKSVSPLLDRQRELESLRGLRRANK